MKYWIFTVTSQRSEGKPVAAEEIYQTRMADKFWGLGERTPNRKHLAPNDRVVFYVGMPQMVFRGTAEIVNSAFALDTKQKNQYKHGLTLYEPTHGVELESIVMWETTKQVKEMLNHLDFIENVEHWGTYLQGGVREISAEDYRRITEGVDIPLVDRIRRTDDIASQSEFALESHLEEFVDKNWGRIDWGTRLTLYEADGQSGRQFPAGTWSIDFLAEDEDSGDLVVIELKKGKTSDAVVGQLLRYMSWVKENVALPNQAVRGIIIAKEVADGLKYSVLGLGNVEVMTYRVDFELKPVPIKA